MGSLAGIDYRAERLALLREQTSDRPEHGAYLEELIRLHEAGKADVEWPVTDRVVSARVQDALDDDVITAYENLAGFGRYESLRGTAARAARDAARTRALRASSLEALLP